MLASNSFRCWHFSCLSNCSTFAISQIVSTRRRESDPDVRWPEKHKGPVLLGLCKHFQGRVLASNCFQWWHFSCLSNCWTLAISELVSPRRRDSDGDVRWLEKRKAPVLVHLCKRFQRRVLASNSFHCWHFSCLSSCWTFTISQLISPRRRDSDGDSRCLEKRKAPVLLHLCKHFQGRVLASNSFQCWHFS